MAVSFKDFEIEIHKIVKEMKFDTKSSISLHGPYG